MRQGQWWSGALLLKITVVTMVVMTMMARIGVVMRAEETAVRVETGAGCMTMTLEK
jgi:hypothetical protein